MRQGGLALHSYTENHPLPSFIHESDCPGEGKSSVEHRASLSTFILQQREASQELLMDKAFCHTSAPTARLPI